MDSWFIILISVLLISRPARLPPTWFDDWLENTFSHALLFLWISPPAMSPPTLLFRWVVVVFLELFVDRLEITTFNVHPALSPAMNVKACVRYSIIDPSLWFWSAFFEKTVASVAYGYHRVYCRKWTTSGLLHALFPSQSLFMAGSFQMGSLKFTQAWSVFSWPVAACPQRQLTTHSGCSSAGW